MQRALLLVVFLAVTGCSMVSHWWRDTTALKTVNVQASDDVNDFSAVMVDLVFVHDKDRCAVYRCRPIFVSKALHYQEIIVMHNGCWSTRTM